MAYTEESIRASFEAILIKIENGKALRNILKEDNMPSTQTFYNWIDGDSYKSKRYARACEVRADAIFDEIIDIADETNKDTIIKDGFEIQNSEWISRSRLRVDARKWIVSKLNPKKYGDKTDITTNGKDIEMPIFKGINLNVTTDDSSD
ncbi:MAG: hypothetical protein WAW57_15235 [Lutibacter sp.]